MGRVAAEMISPYPPGVPAILPGEVFNAPVVSYLRAGLAAGMIIPDAADPGWKPSAWSPGTEPRPQPNARRPPG